MKTGSDFFNWIEAHNADNPSKLRLKYHNALGNIDYGFAILQIECRRKFQTKFADILAAAPKFVFPSMLAAEQATGCLLAKFHSSLVPEGGAVADLTAGLGIDAFAIADRAANVTAVELDSERAEALRHNINALNAQNVEIVEGDCIDFIRKCIAEQKHFDTVFIDPARRDDAGGRVFALSDCRPDVVELMPMISKIADTLIIKASPMLDLAHTESLLPVRPSAMIAVGTPAECKELLVIVNFTTPPTEPMLEAMTLSRNSASNFTFTRTEEENSPVPPAEPAPEPGHFLYEGSPSLMKTGAFKCIAKAFGLSIFHANTKLFHSPDLVDGFPGNRYRIVEVLPYASKVIKRFRSRYPMINVAVRNFGIGADALRAKLNVNDGGDLKVFGITDNKGERLLIVAEKA